MRRTRIASVAIECSLRRLRTNTPQNSLVPYATKRSQSTHDLRVTKKTFKTFKTSSNKAAGRDEILSGTRKLIKENESITENQYPELQIKTENLDNVVRGSESSQLHTQDNGIVDLFSNPTHTWLVKADMIPEGEISFDDRFVSMSRNRDTGDFQQMDQSWHINFATLLARNLTEDSSLEPVVSFGGRRDFAEVIQLFNGSGKSTNDDGWQAAGYRLVGLQSYKSRKEWSDFMILIMRFMPHLTAGVLQASYSSLKPPFYMVADIIHFIARFGMQDKDQLKTSQHKGQTPRKLLPIEVVELILDIIPQCTHESKTILNSTIVRLLDQIDLKVGYALFNGLRSFDTRFELSSCMAFSEFFGVNGEYETALDALDMFLERGGAATEGIFLATASKILRRSIVNPQGYHNGGYIIGRYMEMGLDIGVHFQTTLIANAFDSQDAPTAINVFSLMRQQGVEPNAVTYSAMLKGLRDSEHGELTDEILELAWAKVEETRHDGLAGELLYWYFSQQMRRAAKSWEKEERAVIYTESLREVLRLSARLFDDEPLRCLGLSGLASYDGWSRSSSLNIEPTPFAMNVILLAYTRANRFLKPEDDIANPQEQADTNYRVYQRWWDIATQWPRFPEVNQWVKELFVEMMKTPYTFSVFMQALGAHTQTLHRTITILQQMDTGRVGITRGLPEVDHYREEPIAMPDMFSWTILLNAFARHGQVDAAEKCFETMKSKGFPQDAAAWNALVKAYAVKQHSVGVVHTLRRKETAGFGTEGGLVRVLTRVRDHGTLKALLEREVRYRDGDISDGKLLGSSGSDRSRRKLGYYEKWTPEKEQVVGYEPGVGTRQVQYFDANRTTGLHKESWTVDEAGDDKGAMEVAPPNVSRKADPLILSGEGSFTLKSENEEDWFEEDEEDEGDFDASPMDGIRKGWQ